MRPPAGCDDHSQAGASSRRHAASASRSKDYVNGNLASDGEIDVAHREALIYQPVRNKRRLVGVGYIVDAARWQKA
jgi:hypothetical protein